MDVDYKALFERLTKRYGDVTPKALESIFCPVLIPIHTLDKTIHKVAGQSHYRANFTIKIDADCEDLVVPGRTGKFVPKTYKDGSVWREITEYAGEVKSPAHGHPHSQAALNLSNRLPFSPRSVS
jgi:hypothetical protein